VGPLKSEGNLEGGKKGYPPFEKNWPRKAGVRLREKGLKEREGGGGQWEGVKVRF